jgi:hypothetical protein
VQAQSGGGYKDGRSGIVVSKQEALASSGGLGADAVFHLAQNPQGLTHSVLVQYFREEFLGAGTVNKF